MIENKVINLHEVSRVGINIPKCEGSYNIGNRYMGMWYSLFYGMLNTFL